MQNVPEMKLTCPHCNKTYSTSGRVALVMGCGMCGTRFVPAVDPLAPTLMDPQGAASSSGQKPTPRALASDVSERYEIVGLLGRGGMGTIFLARDRHSGRRVCIKQLNAETDGEALRQECEALARLDHPNIVRQFDTFIRNGVPSLVIEYVEGITLESHVQTQGALPEKTAVEIMVQVLGALCYAHEHSVVHRDLKPENVLVEWKDGAPRVRVLDFGIALVDDLDAQGNVTGEAVPIGTPMYMAPEQIEGERLSAAVDVYASGLMLARLTTGRQPFSAMSPMHLLAQKLSGHPEDGLDFSMGPAPLPSRAINKLIGACTRRAPACRPTGAEALAEFQRLLPLTLLA